MLFNSLEFLLFLPIVFILYWYVNKKSLQFQNCLLLLASYYFYACWDWRFLFLLMFSTGLDYYTGLKISSVPNKRAKQFWFWLSIIINLGFLAIFKYYNFFASSFSDALALLGFKASFWTLKVILPVGISFYTFHGLSYVIDVYKNRILPEKNIVTYSLFVSFFPLLVAGPIERATHLLPQIKIKRKFNYYNAVDGLRQILWGLFKKIVIADQCAKFANIIFNNADNYSGSTLFVGAIFFTFQIYGDFSGYSDIAIGTARLFGIELLRNFAYPYFSRDIAEFWRRWHISLSSWFRDYLYIPLGGSSGTMWKKIRNTFIVFIVSGFWHGANWTFIIWGLLNALYIMPSIIFGTNRHNIDIVAQGKKIPSLKDILSMAITFFLTVIAWIFFRSENIAHALSFIRKIFSESIFSIPDFQEDLLVRPTLLFTLLFMITEWFGREDKYAIEKAFLNSHWSVRYLFYFLIISSLFIFSGEEQQFIYFQF